MATNANPIAGRPTAPIDRLNALESKINTPMVCPDCGGTFYFRVTAEQFSDASYGSAQFRSLSMIPEPVYICLCGRLVPNKEAVAERGPDSSHARFINTVKKAVAFQAERDKKILKIAEQAVSVGELEELKDRVKWLEASMNVLLQQTPIEEEPATTTVDEELIVDEPAVGEPAIQQTTTTAPEATPQPSVEQISKPPRTGRPAKTGKAAA